MTPFGIVIPARMNSTRLPGKPLLPLAGKPLVLWVWELARRTRADFVVVAADDQRILDVVHAAGGEAIWTAPHHPSGTDRVAEVVRSRGLADDAIIVNLQGDEPLLEPRLVELVADALGERPEVSLATLATPILTVDDLFSPHVVKVVLDQAGLAKTFGRAPLPWVRDAFGEGPHRPETLPEGVQFLRHVGLYAYRSGALRTLTQTPPPVWERAESLEQLRALWLGMSIHVSVLEEAPHHGVDTPQDAELASRVLTLRQRDLAPHPETHRPAG